MYELTIKQKLANYYYFVICNSVLSVIIAIAYWQNIYLYKPELSDWLAIIYMLSNHAIILILMTSVAGLTMLPTIYLSGKQRCIVQAILTAIFFGVLYFDVRVFQSGFSHIVNLDTTIAMNIFTSSNLMFTPNKIIAYIGGVIFLGIIYRFNLWINKTAWFKNNSIGKKFIILLVTLTITPLLIYSVAGKERKQQLLAYIQYLPLYANNDEVATKIHSTYKSIKTAKLQYPLQPLLTTTIINPPNILIIAMDAWRADCFNAVDSPNLWQFAKQGKIFNNHKSAANCTFSSLFGLFYGIPATYKDSFFINKISSLFFKRLKKLNYQINSFTTNDKDELLQFYIDINNLNVLRNEATRQYKNDEQLTKDYLKWQQELNKSKPWFAFVFYDSLHGPDFPENYSTTEKPAIGLRNYKKFATKISKKSFIASYKTSVHYIDSLASKIIQQLKNSNDIDNTIVIITADHGCEWDDNNQGEYGYGSNYTDCQLQVPCAIILPRKFQQMLVIESDTLTSHYDIAPTLMHNFLGVTNDITDYSIGNNLFSNNKKQDWHLAAHTPGYGAHISAVVEKNKTLRIHYNANYYLLDNRNRFLLNNKITTQYLNQALEYMTRFIKK